MFVFKRLALAVCLALAGALTFACSGSGKPYVPPPGPDPTPTPPANNLPVIDSITFQGTRAKEPADFADVAETVPVVAKVHDDETAADQLEYQWTATAGTFSGTGAKVTWTAPASASTPVDVTITLKVVEKYGLPGQAPSFSHDVSGTQTIALHDSIKEVGDMARQFLLDFSDSSIKDVPYIMRNFDMTCQGAQHEFDDVADNRKGSRIEKYAIGSPTVMLPFGDAFCPIDGGRTQRGDACSKTPSRWESTDLSNGHYIIAEGNDWVSAYYKADTRVWKLCDSQFPGVCFDATKGTVCGADALARLVPDSALRRTGSR